MKTKVIILFALFSICKISAQETIYGDLTHDNIERAYILYVPASYDGLNAVPLVLNFHGYSSNAWQQMIYGDFREIADQEGFLIVHPEGTLDNTGISHFNVGFGASTVNDISFSSALIDYIASEYNIDLSRVYSTGMSNGGFMSYGLACELSDKIAAIASVTGSMTPPQSSSCNPSHPMPVMEIHGTADDVVPYNGSSFSNSITAVLDYWTSFNNCGSNPSVIDVPDSDTSDNSTVEHYVYSHGDNNVRVELFKITGGGHTWPSNFLNSQGTNNDIDASREIWDFFSEYNIDGKTTAVKTLEKPTAFILSPNPTSGEITISKEAIGLEFQMTNILGKKVDRGILKTNSIDLSYKQPGLYFLNIAGSTYKVYKN